MKSLEMAQEVVLIGHDATKRNNAMLLDGTLDANIDRNARVEARAALASFVSAIRGEKHLAMTTRLQVMFRENLPDD